ncbi:terminase small subunit [Limosilactobacillus fermentum]|uniref:terminase small subunit n=1 Tax=Limosilactobacillus fermentum TaxID=1613 RepID=UPI0022DEEBA4|nr:terminase small subunit [Limosilactobacillus fermentum]
MVSVFLFKEVSGITQKLTQKQQRFVDEYIISGNATQSYKAAGSIPSTDIRKEMADMAKVHQCGEIRCHRIIPFDQRYCNVHAKLHAHDAYHNVSHKQRLESYKIYNREHRDQTANAFYHSKEWQRVRAYVVNRDMYASGVSGITLTDHDLIVDHVVPRRLCKDPLDTDNLWCLSRREHLAKTKMEKHIADKPNGDNVLKHLNRQKWSVYIDRQLTREKHRDGR